LTGPYLNADRLDGLDSTNLNANRLDGLDSSAFLRAYIESTLAGFGDAETGDAGADCGDDIVIGGTLDDVDPGSSVNSVRVDWVSNIWRVNLTAVSGGDDITLTALCWDIDGDGPE
jgi:hypothetical protein